MKIKRYDDFVNENLNNEALNESALVDKVVPIIKSIVTGTAAAGISIAAAKSANEAFKQLEAGKLGDKGKKFASWIKELASKGEQVEVEANEDVAALTSLLTNSLVALTATAAGAVIGGVSYLILKGILLKLEDGELGEPGKELAKLLTGLSTKAKLVFKKS